MISMAQQREVHCHLTQACTALPTHEAAPKHGADAMSLGQLCCLMKVAWQVASVWKMLPANCLASGVLHEQVRVRPCSDQLPGRSRV